MNVLASSPSGGTTVRLLYAATKRPPVGRRPLFHSGSGSITHPMVAPIPSPPYFPTSLWVLPGLTSQTNYLPANAGDSGSIPGSGRSLGVGNGNLLQYSCLENSTDRGAWWGYSPRSCKESNATECAQHSTENTRCEYTAPLAREAPAKWTLSHPGRVPFTLRQGTLRRPD